jgi:hypothetical protein
MTGRASSNLLVQIGFSQQRSIQSCNQPSYNHHRNLDLGAKQNAYRRNGVEEYLVWQTFENRFSWFRLQAEEFVFVEPDRDGVIRSSTFPGLWLAVPALLEGRMMDVLTVLQAGIADPAHQALVEALANGKDEG